MQYFPRNHHLCISFNGISIKFFGKKYNIFFSPKSPFILILKYSMHQLDGDPIENNALNFLRLLEE